MQKVDSEIRRIIDEQYGVARKIIEENSEKMHAMANALLEWETIDADQIDDIAQGKNPRPPKSLTKIVAITQTQGPGQQRVVLCLLMRLHRQLINQAIYINFRK